MYHCPCNRIFGFILQGIIGFIRGEEGLDSSGLSSSAAVGVHLFFSHKHSMFSAVLIAFQIIHSHMFELPCLPFIF